MINPAAVHTFPTCWSVKLLYLPMVTVLFRTECRINPALRNLATWKRSSLTYCINFLPATSHILAVQSAEDVMICLLSRDHDTARIDPLSASGSAFRSPFFSPVSPL